MNFKDNLRVLLVVSLLVVVGPSFGGFPVQTAQGEVPDVSVGSDRSEILRISVEDIPMIITTEGILGIVTGAYCLALSDHGRNISARLAPIVEGEIIEREFIVYISHSHWIHFIRYPKFIEELEERVIEYAEQLLVDVKDIEDWDQNYPDMIVEMGKTEYTVEKAKQKLVEIGQLYRVYENLIAIRMRDPAFLVNTESIEEVLGQIYRKSVVIRSIAEAFRMARMRDLASPYLSIVEAMGQIYRKAEEEVKQGPLPSQGRHWLWLGLVLGVVIGVTLVVFLGK